MPPLEVHLLEALLARARKALHAAEEKSAHFPPGSGLPPIADWAMDLFRDRTGLLDSVSDDEHRVLNLKDLVGALARYERRRWAEKPDAGDDWEPPTLHDALARLALDAEEDDREDEDQDAVVLMTLHSAKGLEFDEVFLVGLEEGIIPHSRSLVDGSAGGGAAGAGAGPGSAGDPLAEERIGRVRAARPEARLREGAHGGGRRVPERRHQEHVRREGRGHHDARERERRSRWHPGPPLRASQAPGIRHPRPGSDRELLDEPVPSERLHLPHPQFRGQSHNPARRFHGAVVRLDDRQAARDMAAGAARQVLQPRLHVDDDAVAQAPRLLVPDADDARGDGIDGRVNLAALEQVGMTQLEVEDMYHVMAIANYEDRFVIPSTHREYAENTFDIRGGCGFSFGNGCSDGSNKVSLFGGTRKRTIPIKAQV